MVHIGYFLWFRKYNLSLAETKKNRTRLSPEATVITVWKTPVCKSGICKRGILKHPIFNILNFRGWIKRIFDTVDYCNFVINELNPTYEFQNMGNGAFQNALFWNAPFANSRFPNSDYSCLWAMSCTRLIFAKSRSNLEVNKWLGFTLLVLQIYIFSRCTLLYKQQ